MIDNKEICAIIVARKGSKRIPSKNMLKLEGETLIERKIRQLTQSKYIDRVVFGSDSEEMLELASSCGAEAVRRPDFFCNEDFASANDMISNMMSLLETDIVVWAHCTNPLITPSTYDKAILTYSEGLKQGYDSLLSVTELKEHLWSTEKKPLNYDPYKSRHTPARELPPYYMQDGGIFIQPYIQMKNNSYFFGANPLLFIIPKEEFLDINDPRDFLLAKAIVSDKNK